MWKIWERGEDVRVEYRARVHPIPTEGLLPLEPNTCSRPWTLECIPDHLRGRISPASGRCNTGLDRRTDGATTSKDMPSRNG
jgi:hypothetical protein